MAHGRTFPVFTATRLTEEQRATVDFAARLEGTTITDFLRRAALREARERVAQHVHGDSIVGGGEAQ